MAKNKAALEKFKMEAANEYDVLRCSELKYPAIP